MIRSAIRGPFVEAVPGVDRSLAHILNNAGKKSLALDFGQPESWTAVGRIAENSNLLIAPIEPTTACRRFLETALDGLPGLGIVDAVFRRDSMEQAPSDLAGTAAGGLLRLNGYPEDPPNHPAGQLAYKQTSLAAAWAAMGLILEQKISGRGGRVTVSMQEAMMWTTIQTANENYWYWNKTRPNRTGIAGLGGRTIFQARDGGWVSFYQHPPSWSAFADWVAVELGDTTFTNLEWSDGLYRFQHFGVIAEATIRLCEAMDRADLVAEAQRRSILVVPVQDAADICQDPHLRERGFFQSVHYPHLGKDLEVLRSPFRSSAYEVEPGPAPALGEDSVSVLKEVGGFSNDEIERMIGAGIVLAPAGANQ